MHLENSESLGLQESLVKLGKMARQGRLVLQVNQELLVQTVFEVREVNLDILVTKVPGERRVTQEHLAHLDKMVLVENQELLDQWDLRDNMGHQDKMAYTE